MNKHEIELIQQLNSWINQNDPTPLLDRIRTNEGGLYNSHDFLMEVSKKLPQIFNFLLLDERFDIHPEVYISAGINSPQGYLLKYFGHSSHLKGYLNYEELIPLIIERHWDALEEWPEFARQEKWVELANTLHYGAFQFASEELKNSKEFVAKIILKRASCFRYASEEVRNDEKIALLAVIHDHTNFVHVGKIPAMNYEICYHAVSGNPSYIHLVSTEISNYKNLLERAISLDPSAKKYVAKKLLEPKIAFNKMKEKATLELAYGATPPRISKLKNTQIHLGNGIIKITLLIQGQLESFQLPIKKINSPHEIADKVNIDLTKDSYDKNRFLEWQKSITESGALKIVIENIGIGNEPLFFQLNS